MAIMVVHQIYKSMYLYKIYIMYMLYIENPYIQLLTDKIFAEPVISNI